MADGAGKDARWFILLLGMLIGLVIGFVVILSRLPVDTDLVGENGTEVDPLPVDDLLDFDYYEFLPGQTVSRAEPYAHPSRRIEVRREVVKTTEPPPALAAAVPVQAATQGSRNVPVIRPGQKTYFLQAGSFANRENAERARIRLISMGLEPFVVRRADERGNVTHRVRVGPFKNQAALTNARDTLRSSGIPFQIVRVTS